MADRFDRRSIVRLCQLVEGCAVALLAVSSWGGWASKENILAIVFVIGAAHAFEAPTMQALLPALVPAEIFPRATARAVSAFETATIIGPALGGLLYATGEGIVYGVGALMFFLASLLVSLIRVEGSAPPRARGSALGLHGIAFIRGRPEILGAISLDLFAVLLGGARPCFDLRAGHPRHRAVGIGNPAFGPRRGRARDVGRPGPGAPAAAAGTPHVRGSGPLRDGYHRLRRFTIPPPIPGSPVRVGSRGRRQRGHPLLPCAALDP